MKEWIKNLILDIQLIAIAVIAVNSSNALNEGFSWLGLGVFLSGMTLVGMALFLRNYPHEENVTTKKC